MAAAETLDALNPVAGPDLPTLRSGAAFERDTPRVNLRSRPGTAQNVGFQNRPRNDTRRPLVRPQALAGGLSSALKLRIHVA